MLRTYDPVISGDLEDRIHRHNRNDRNGALAPRQKRPWSGAPAGFRRVAIILQPNPRMTVAVHAKLFAQATKELELRSIVNHLKAFSQHRSNGLERLDWHCQRDVFRALVKRVEIGKEEVRVIYKVARALKIEFNGEMKSGRVLIGILNLALMVCGLAKGDSQVVVVDSFDQAVQNEVQGYRSAFYRAPSRASLLRVEDGTRNYQRLSRSKDLVHVRRCMRVRAEKRKTGFCGLWVHFFDRRADSPSYFDASRFTHLSFWVKGERGGEDFEICLADKTWIARQDSVPLGKVGRFLAGGVTTHWQEVVIPLSDVGQRLDLSRLGGFTIRFPSAGEFTVYIDDISFKPSASSPVPTTLDNVGSFVELSAQPRAMWLWETAQLLAEPARWTNLFDFCKQQKVSQLWMQLPITVDSPESSGTEEAVRPQTWTPKCEIQRQAELRGFLRRAHQQGLSVHALDGAPEYCVGEQRKIPLAVVDAVIEFNQRVNREERFDGIHFDNEPYLLVAWYSRKLREKILREFLELNAACQRRVQQSDMQYGVDIPFWWHAKAGDGETHGSVHFRGVRKAASYHCIDILDNVGVMNYRDAADGADGMLAHGRELLAYADEVRGAAVFMGVELFAYPDRTVWFCVGLPRDQFEKAVLQNPSVSLRSRIAGYPMRLLDDGAFVHLGIEVPDLMTQSDVADATGALRELSAMFGLANLPESRSQVDGVKRRASRAVESHPEWKLFRDCDIRYENGEKMIPGFRAESIMISKVTFADNSYRDFQEQTNSAARFFRRFHCFRGLAIHFYKPYRELVETPQTHRPGPQ